MHRPVLVTPPARPLIDKADAKANLRVDGSDEDKRIAALVAAAVSYLDGWSGVLGRCLITQTWRQDFGGWPANGTLRLPFPDVQSVTVKYYDADNTEQTVSSSLYELLEDARGAYVKFLTAFTSPTLYDERSGPVQVTLVAGYGDDPDNVPEAIVTAAHLLVAHWYRHREAVAEGSLANLPLGAVALIESFRRRT